MSNINLTTVTDNPLGMFYIMALVGFYVARPIIVLIHELGHAIPMIILTRQKVIMYVGSNGDPKDSLHLNLGLLEIWFKFHFFTWDNGVCISTAKTVSVKGQIIYTAAGPFAASFVAGILFGFAYTFDASWQLWMLWIVFAGFAIYDLIRNLIPSSTAYRLHDGRITYNDGHQLLELRQMKNIPEEYNQAFKLYEQGSFNEAAEIAKQLLQGDWKHPSVYRVAMYSLAEAKECEQVRALFSEFVELHEPEVNDYLTLAVCCSRLEEHAIALDYYDKALALGPENPTALNNKGYTMNLMERYEEAIELFDRAIVFDESPAYAYNNRGLSKIKLGNAEEGLADIQHSLNLDPNNSYAYRNLGIYHLDRGEKDNALNLFMKARELDESTHLIDELIRQAQE